MSNRHGRVDEVADGVYRLGSQYVNWYVVVDDGHITIVDTGLPSYWSQLTDLLSTIGRRLDDIEAVLITHAHPDHMGIAARLAALSASPALLHKADEAKARKVGPNPPPRVQLWRPPVLAFLGHGLRNRMTSWPALTSVQTIIDNAPLDIPGKPLAIHTPGHTDGSTCFAFDDRDTVIVGDTLFNKDPHSGRAGILVSPERFSADQPSAISSLSKLENLDHTTVLFGHGEPSHRGIKKVLTDARRSLV